MAQWYTRTHWLCPATNSFSRCPSKLRPRCCQLCQKSCVFQKASFNKAAFAFCKLQFQAVSRWLDWCADCICCSLRLGLFCSSLWFVLLEACCQGLLISPKRRTNLSFRSKSRGTQWKSHTVSWSRKWLAWKGRGKIFVSCSNLIQSLLAHFGFDLD